MTNNSNNSSNIDSMMFQFQLDETTLIVKRSTALLTNTLVLASGLHELSPSMIKDELYSRSSDGLIQRGDFIDFVKNRNNLNINKEQHSGLVAILLAIFSSLDRTSSGCVDVVELICSLIVLCEGNKSQKLAFAFELIDEDKDGLLSRRDLWRFFRSFLCTLITLCKSNIDTAVTASPELLDQLAVWTASRLLAWEQSSTTSFENLADWYTYTGYNVASFIELLDLKKWLPVYSNHHPTSQKPQKKRPPSSEQFHVDLPFGNRLTFEESHAAFIQKLSYITGLAEQDPFDFTRMLVNWSHDGCITKYSIYQVMAKMFGYQGGGDPRALDNPQLDYTMEILMRLFDFLDEDKDGVVELPLIVTTLSVLCAGSKSHKLNLGFQLWDDGSGDSNSNGDSSGDGATFISKMSLAMLLYSYLAVFYFVSVEGQVDTSSSVNTLLLESCKAFTNGISVSERGRGGGGGGGGVSFESFGAWYNGTGFHLMPWIELINLSKWKYALVNETKPSEYNDDDDDDDDDDDGDDDDEDLTEAFTIVVYTHHSSSNASYLKVSKATTNKYCQFTKEIAAPGDIVTIFFDGAEDGLISETAFDDIVGTLFAAIRKPHLKSSLRLDDFFKAFDRAGAGSVVDVVELCIGFTIFLEGSKSSKLALAFDLLDDDKDGVLSRRDIWRFFRSFLCGLMFACGLMADDDYEIKFLLDASCVWLCDSLFSSIPDGRNVAYFDDIADWYSSNGFKVASWLELLDRKKWEILSNQSA